MVGGMEGQTPFQNMGAYAPVTDVVFAPGQMRLFTIKTMLSGNVLPYIGTQLMIDVTSLDTDANVKALFPIRGTTWTIQ